MSLLKEEDDKVEIISDQDESFGKNSKHFLENKRSRRNNSYQINNDENEINNEKIGPILNIQEYITKIKNENTQTLLNSDMILFILELCLNSYQFNLKGDNSSRKFWEQVGRIELISPVTKIFKPETLRKYWRLLRSINQPKKIINVIKEYNDSLNNVNIKLLSCISIVYDYLLCKKKGVGIDFFIDKYCGKFINKAKRGKNLKEMTTEEQIDEIIKEFKKAFPLKKEEEIVEKLYQNSFDIKNTYLVLKDEVNFGYLSFNEKDDEMVMENLTLAKYKEFAKQKGHNNILKRKKFLVGNSINTTKK